MFFFFFNDTATTEIYTLSLHDALPIYQHAAQRRGRRGVEAAAHRAMLRDMVVDDARDPHVAELAEQRAQQRFLEPVVLVERDRKSTRLNSSHLVISYAVFCLKKTQKDSKHVAHRDLSHFAQAVHQVN